MSNSSEYQKYLSTEDQLRDLLRQGKRDPRTVRQQLQAIISGQGELRPAVPGSEITVSLKDCQDFLAFCEAEDSDLENFTQQAKPEGFFWPLPCPSELSYDRLAELRLAELIVDLKIPHYDWVPGALREQVDRSFDCRKAGDGNYLLWTPAGIESRDACPQFRGRSYRQLWQKPEEILTLREMVILWIFIFWKTRGQVKLDPKGWTRTGSRYVDGNGARVYWGAGRLCVGWAHPDDANPGGGARLAVSA